MTTEAGRKRGDQSGGSDRSPSDSVRAHVDRIVDLDQIHGIHLRRRLRSDGES